MKKILITGFPGFISHHYLKDLIALNEITDFNFLVHPLMLKKAEKDIKSFKNDHPSVNFELFEGDITKDGLGLPDKMEIHAIHHLAAIYDLAVTAEMGNLINVKGTQNVINWARRQPSLKQIVYFSTCYVLGNNSILKEEFIDHPGGVKEFNNHYEHTKWAAEELFRDVPNALIIRPSVVVGNSLTGLTEKEDGPYFVINFVKKLKYLSLCCPNLGSDDIFVNTIPVDILCKLAAFWVQQHEKEGFQQKIVNIADPNPPTTRNYYRKIVQTVTNLSPVQFDPVKPLILTSLRLPGMDRFTGIKPSTLDYFSWKGQIQTNSVKTNEFPSMIEHLSKTIYPDIHG